MKKKPELLAPAGSFEAAIAALRYGADAVYLGLPRFSARADANNLSTEDLRQLLAYAHSFAPVKKVYVAFNTLMQDGELPQVIETLMELADMQPDALILQDLGIARLVRRHFPSLALHASTQLATHNLAGVLALKNLGFTRVVLARELSLREISAIVANSGVEIEVFIHGALCYSVSGVCLFSSHASGRSGNRGRCAYCCREAFTPRNQHQVAANFPFSMRDLSLAPLLDEVVATGVHSLKIEGRMKAPLYVACVSDYYRRKLDNQLSPVAESELLHDLQTIFSRPLTTLYAEAEQLHSSTDTIIDAAAVGHRGVAIGQVEAVQRDQSGVRWLRFHSNRALEKYDGLQIESMDASVTLGQSGKPYGLPVRQLRLARHHTACLQTPACTLVEVALPADNTPHIPAGALVFCSASQAVRRRYAINSIRDAELTPVQAVDFAIKLTPTGIAVQGSIVLPGSGAIEAATFHAIPLTAARQPEQTMLAVRKAFERLGTIQWRCGTLTLQDHWQLYAPPSKLNEARRQTLTALTDAWHSAKMRKIDMVVAECFGTSRSTAAPLADGSKTKLEFTLKLRLDEPPPSADILNGITSYVLAIGHTSGENLENQLVHWQKLIPDEQLTLALPLLTRDLPTHNSCALDTQTESALLRFAIKHLVERGWQRWECADLAGYQTLTQCGIVPISADWSLYATNRAALAELGALGLKRCVLSPESSRENIKSLLEIAQQTTHTYPTPEVLAYQDTPLFISETPPKTELHNNAIALTNRRGQNYTTHLLDNRWVTISDTPWCIVNRLREVQARHVRLDFSWSKPGTCNNHLLSALLAEQPPLPFHIANFERGFQ